MTVSWRAQPPVCSSPTSLICFLFLSQLVELLFKLIVRGRGLIRSVAKHVFRILNETTTTENNPVVNYMMRVALGVSSFRKETECSWSRSNSCFNEPSKKTSKSIYLTRITRSFKCCLVPGNHTISPTQALGRWYVRSVLLLLDYQRSSSIAWEAQSWIKKKAN